MAAKEITYRDTQWDLDGLTLCADIEFVAIYTSWNGQAHGWDFEALIRHAFRPAYMPWVKQAMIAWIAQNQAVLDEAYNQQERDAGHDDIWSRQLRSTRPSFGTNL